MAYIIRSVKQGDSIASEGKGNYLFVEGRVLDLQGKPISGAVIDTWETDGFGLYDNQVCYVIVTRRKLGSDALAITVRNSRRA